MPLAGGWRNGEAGPMNTTAMDATKHARRWWTLGVLALSLVLIGMDNTILNVALPTIQREVSAARAAMGVGAALIMPSTLSIIVDVFKGPERARAIAIWAASAGIAVGLGP